MIKIKAKIKLKRGKEDPILRGHLWVFSGAVHSMEGNPEDGDLVEVLNADGKSMGWGHWQGHASICVRLIAHQMPDENFYAHKLENAVAKRSQIGLPSEQTNCCRMVHGEGDHLPGLVIDVYHEVAVIQAHTTGMMRDAAHIATTLEKALPSLQTIVLMDERKKVENNVSLLKGNLEDTIVKENGQSFKVNWMEGQKTGFFLDQRTNRELLGRYSKNKKVLNAFSYSGGFSVYALNSGAHEVHSVDISEKAIRMAEENVRLNGKMDQHQSVVADVTKYLNDIADDFDIIVLDPPAFAKRKDARHKAIMGYKNLNFKALRKMKPGSLLFTFSCSQVVSKDHFRGAVMAAGIDAGRKLSVLHQLHQPEDHPINLYQPETEYLKGLVLYVE